MFICTYFPFFRLELGCVHLCLLSVFSVWNEVFVCAYFPFSRFGIRLCLFVHIFRFLGLELGCVHLCLLFSRFGIRLFICAIFHFLGLELGCVHLCLFSIFSVWN